MTPILPARGFRRGTYEHTSLVQFVCQSHRFHSMMLVFVSNVQQTTTLGLRTNTEFHRSLSDIVLSNSSRSVGASSGKSAFYSPNVGG